MIFAVTYDLNKVGQDYSSLYRKIEGLGQTFHALQNLWFLSTNYNAGTVREELRKVMDNNDMVFVAQLYKGSYSGWIPVKAHDWLEARL